MLNRTGPGAKRVFARLGELYSIGGGPGANRPAGSREEDEAHELAARWMEEAGLVVEVDADGNLMGRASERDDVWTGSHLDSVPRGGKFDGALGVVAGIEAVERVGRGAVVAFRGEEIGCVGSRARVSGSALPAAFIELHVEQGTRLAGLGAPLGVVTSIVGYARRRVEFEGRAGHAGTTPMAERDDALCKAAAYVMRVRDAAHGIDDAVATVGRVDVEPGAMNVIPGRVVLWVDARAPDDDRLERLLASLELDTAPRTAPAAMDSGVRGVLSQVLEGLGLPVVELASGAGHDAGVLASAGVPSGMLFVRSLAGGVSHSPDEESSEEDVALGIDALAAALARLSGAAAGS